MMTVQCGAADERAVEAGLVGGGEQDGWRLGFSVCVLGFILGGVLRRTGEYFWYKHIPERSLLRQSEK